MRIILILLMITFLAGIVNSAVLDDIYFNAKDASHKNYGQYDYAESFYLNPTLLSKLKNKQLNINYANFYQGQGFGFNSFGFSFGLPLKKISAGIFSQVFMDTSEDFASYSETKIGVGISFPVRNLKLGILFDYTMISLKFDSDISFIPDNKYSDSTPGIIPGLTYDLPDYKLKLGYAFHNTYEHLFGAAYYFSELSALGMSIKKLYSTITIALTGTASIIKDRIILNFGLSPQEYSPGLRIKLPVKEDKNFLFLNYTMCYNIYMKDSHYASFEMNF